MRCGQCNVDYPDYLLAPMGTSAPAYNRMMTCGICYLFLSNMITFKNRTKLDGKDSEALRQRAIRFREYHKPYVHNPWKEAKEIKFKLVDFWDLQLGTEGYDQLSRAIEYLRQLYGEQP